MLVEMTVMFSEGNELKTRVVLTQSRTGTCDGSFPFLHTLLRRRLAF